MTADVRSVHVRCLCGVEETFLGPDCEKAFRVWEDTHECGEVNLFEAFHQAAEAYLPVRARDVI